MCERSRALRAACSSDDAVKALDNIPRFKKLSPELKRQLVEFIIGNTLFVLSHEMGHGVINEMNLPVLGREEDAADSFAITTALRLNTDTQHLAYVLRPGETDAPEGLRRALTNANTLQDIVMDEIRPGRSENDILSAARARLQAIRRRKVRCNSYEAG